MEYLSHSEQETEALGAALAQRLESGKQSLKALRELEETAASAARESVHSKRYFAASRSLLSRNFSK